MYFAENDARLDDRKCRIGGFPHRLVHKALSFGEPTVHGEGTRDVGRVQAFHFDARIHQNKVTVAHGAVISDPVEGAGVMAGCGDGFVADLVSLRPSTSIEGSFD